MGAIRVDNYSGKWLKLDSEGIFIPPFTAGYVVDVYVQTMRLKIGLQSPPSLIGQQVNDGDVIISIYDDFMPPDTGTFVGYAQFQTSAAYNPSGVVGEFPPSSPGSGTVMGYEYSVPVWFYSTNAFLGGSRLGSRGMSQVFYTGPLAVAASPTWTSLPSIGEPNPGVSVANLMGFAFSVDVSGLVEWRLSGNPTPLFAHYVHAMTPHRILFGANGLPFSAAGQAMQVRNDNACNVMSNFEWGP